MHATHSLASLTVVLTFCFLNVAVGQQPFVKTANEVSPRISSHLRIQDPIRLEEPRRPDQVNEDRASQGSLSDQFQLEDEASNSAGQDEQTLPLRKAFGQWPRKGIQTIQVDIRERNETAPADRSGQLTDGYAANWDQFRPAPKVFAWAAPNIRYQPLYFEDVPLERYGQTAANPYYQSFLSSINYFKSFVLLPHQMRHDAPNSCDYPLGFCRPGNEVPYTIQRTYLGRPKR